MTHRFVRPAAIVSLFLLPSSAAAQSAPDEGTLLIGVGREATSPVPTLWRADGTNREVSDLMFLRLADLPPDLRTTNERVFVPRLARRWERRDSVTLVFELDPRAFWHDGKPVTPADVILSLNRARDPKLSPQLSTLVRRITSVSAEGDRKVVIRFAEPYAEQFYDATYHAPPLPAHLLGGMPAESVATSGFVAEPVGNGPYRWVRRVPAQVVELAANDGFFLGRPRIRRILLQLAGDPEVRVNLLLTGAVDAVENIYSLPNYQRVEQLAGFHYYPVPGLVLTYITLNQRDPADTSRPHPILSDPAVRRALVLALDRQRMAPAAYGQFTVAISAPVSAVLARAVDAPPIPVYDTTAARQLLASRGWSDHDGDGVLDKDGRRLSLSLLVPSPSTPRRNLATRIQEAYRQLGIELNLEILEPPIFLERRGAGRYDLEFYTVSQDPTPSGLVQSWTCGGIGGSNVSHYCNPRVDSLLSRAIVRPREAAPLLREALRLIANDYPAIFVAANVLSVPIHRRFQSVVIRPESAWSAVWQWSVRPGNQIERDREGR